MGLEFSDEEGNNVGTAAELLQTILAGTGWTPGSISTFYEKDMETEKKRSLSAPAKTGAFKLITMMCDLFDAKPVFHGDGRLVDIIPMNPFTEPEEGCLPDVAGASGVIELNYGTNVSGITRVLNTENLVTKLYAYGAYGDIVSGYCGINEGTHKEFVVTLTESIASGETCIFYPEGYPPLQFVASTDMVVGTQLIWSTFDPASMSYIWNSTDEIAYKAISADVIVYTDHAMSA